MEIFFLKSDTQVVLSFLFRSLKQISTKCFLMPRGINSLLPWTSAQWNEPNRFLFHFLLWKIQYLLMYSAYKSKKWNIFSCWTQQILTDRLLCCTSRSSLKSGTEHSYPSQGNIYHRRATEEEISKIARGAWRFWVQWKNQTLKTCKLVLPRHPVHLTARICLKSARPHVAVGAGPKLFPAFYSHILN